MANPSPWPTIHAERKALASDLESLSDEQWDTPSLCAGWTVRDVLAHMTGTAKISPATFLPKLIGSGFRLSAAQEKDIKRERGSSPADTLARFKEQVDSSKHPPGPGDSWLGEALVHAQDIRRPLGITHAYPADALTRVAEFYSGSNLVIGGKKRAAGLTWRATDTDWAKGSGPEVAGPAVSLMMAIAGRQAAVDDLSGEGVATLKGRF
jgi:uncharacterized protein (TIGR03083 family)